MHQHHHPVRLGRILIWSLAATVLFVVVEVLAGLRAGSLALLSDAGHNFTDALALALACLGFYLASKPPNRIKTYGYHRAGVLAAFVNAITLLVLSAFIFYESYHRLLEPQPVEEMTMLIIAGLGLIVNVTIMWGLHRDQGHDLNVRAAYVHMLGDALGSVGIIIGAIVIRYTGWNIIDPILSVIIGALIVWTAWDIVRETLNILLEGVPRGLNLERVLAAMREAPCVRDIHDLHIWSLGARTHALSCHVLIDDVPPSESQPILQELNQMLAARFDIHHTTIQFEHDQCEPCANGCSLPVTATRQHD
ncbi:MAG: cation transporter [bacterium]|nr:cation transporter [bacterium]